MIGLSGNIRVIVEKAANITINRKDIIWNYLAIGISAVSGIITIPILLTKLSGDDLGLWYLYLSIGGITSLFDFGFSVTFARNITYCWSGAKELKKDSVAIESTGEINYCLLKNVLNTCKFIYLIISSVAIIIICLSGIVYFSWITEGSFIRMNMTSWMVYSVSIFLSLFYGYYNAFLKGIGDIGGNSRIVFFSKMIQIICTVLFVEMGFGLIGVCSANLVYGICFRMVSKKRFYNYQGLGQILETIPSESSFAVKKEIFMVVWHNAWRTGITSVASFLSNQSSTLLCGAFMSLTETGHYALANRIVALISSLAAVIYNAYQPSLQATFVNNDCEKRKNIMGGMTSGYIFLFTTGILMLSTIGLPIIRIFKKDISIGIFMILVVAIPF